MIFSTKQRDDYGFKRGAEREFEFLERSARPEIGMVRKMLQSFLVTYPESDRPELISRMKSSDEQFRSSCFELILYSWLSKEKFECQIHPKLDNGSLSKPDFLIKDPAGKEFYLEAVSASELNGQNQGAESRKEIFFDALDAKPHQNFYIDISDAGEPQTQPSAKKLISKLHEWLDSLDPDKIIQSTQKDFDKAPTFDWQYENWEITFRPIPVKASRRGHLERLIGLRDMGGGFVDAWSPIKAALKMKGSKYGVLDKPFVVAVNMDRFHLNRIDEMQALFGQEQFGYRLGSGHSEPEFSRAGNGAWVGESGPQYTRIGGAWVFNNLSPYSIAKVNPTLYFNPWAKQALPESLCKFSHAKANKEKMEWHEGLKPQISFKLADSWPE